MNSIVRALGLLCINLASINAAYSGVEDNGKAAVAAAGEIRTLTPAQVHAQLSRGQTRVFDANTVDIFNKHHVPGAIHVEYDQVKASDLPTDKSASIVFYCMNEQCGASPIAAKLARKLGWKNVYLMPAGIEGWMAARLPVESTH